MQIGPLFIGWRAMDESDRIVLGLESWAPGWEVFRIGWGSSGVMIVARPREGVEL